MYFSDWEYVMVGLFINSVGIIFGGIVGVLFVCYVFK